MVIRLPKKIHFHKKDRPGKETQVKAHVTLQFEIRHANIPPPQAKPIMQSAPGCCFCAKTSKKKFSTRSRREAATLLLFAVVIAVTLVYLLYASYPKKRSTQSRRQHAAEAVLRSSESDDQLQMTDNVLKRHGATFNVTLFRYLPLVPPSTAPGPVHTLQHAVPEGVCLECYVTISYHPRVLYFDRMFTKSEAIALVRAGEPLLVRSGVVAKKAIQSQRTSFGARIPSDSRAAAAISERLLYVLNHYSNNKSARMFKAGHAERLELLRYEGSQRYYGHLDTFGGAKGPLASQRRSDIEKFTRKLETFRTTASSDDKAAIKKALHDMYNRLKAPLLDRGATMVLGLNEIPQEAPGGFTSFPYAIKGVNVSNPWETDEGNATQLAQWLGMLRSFSTSKDDACLLQPTRPEFLRHRPKLGSVVLFYGLYENGVTDPFALHAGCPPVTDRDLDKMVEAELTHTSNSLVTLNATEIRERLSKYLIKEVATKWFMVPIAPSIEEKPPELAMGG